ncbi:MAG: DUF302 domain-containing protein [Hyphomicrobiaceae bacterium]|nr:DUF302 domain-containing protein [Hyphomicrobiaceae bacterium]
MTRLTRYTGWLALVPALLLAASGPAAAQEVRTYSKKGSYDDVRFELTNAVINRGLTIDYTGQIGKMLERTGADVGSEKPLYKSAEFFTFCSAKLSRQMIEADPMNIGFCPYVLFIYESIGQPGVVIVGYRRPPASGSGETKAALAEVEALLDGIARDALN